MPDPADITKLDDEADRLAKSGRNSEAAEKYAQAAELHRKAAEEARRRGDAAAAAEEDDKSNDDHFNAAANHAIMGKYYNGPEAADHHDYRKSMEELSKAADEYLKAYRGYSASGALKKEAGNVSAGRAASYERSSDARGDDAATKKFDDEQTVYFYGLAKSEYAGAAEDYDRASKSLERASKCFSGVKTDIDLLYDDDSHESEAKQAEKKANELKDQAARYLKQSQDCEELSSKMASKEKRERREAQQDGH
jgi:hypothetical protein